MLVNLFLESMPDLTLRLDANRAWTPAKALKFAQYVAPSLRSRIAFLEEPCQSPSESIAFSIDTGIAIAWDETLQEAVRDADFALENLLGVKTIVIKPTLIGSVYRVEALIEKAKALGLQAVISSSLESSLGLNQLSRLAHKLLPNEVPGLDTMGLFRAQLETLGQIAHCLWLPARAVNRMALGIFPVSLWQPWLERDSKQVALSHAGKP